MRTTLAAVALAITVAVTTAGCSGAGPTPAPAAPAVIASSTIPTTTSSAAPTTTTTTSAAPTTTTSKTATKKAAAPTPTTTKRKLTCEPYADARLVGDVIVNKACPPNRAKEKADKAFASCPNSWNIDEQRCMTRAERSRQAEVDRVIEEEAQPTGDELCDPTEGRCGGESIGGAWANCDPAKWNPEEARCES